MISISSRSCSLASLSVLSKTKVKFKLLRFLAFCTVNLEVESGSTSPMVHPPRKILVAMLDLNHSIKVPRDEKNSTVILSKKERKNRPYFYGFISVSY